MCRVDIDPNKSPELIGLNVHFEKRRRESRGLEVGLQILKIHVVEIPAIPTDSLNLAGRPLEITLFNAIPVILIKPRGKQLVNRSVGFQGEDFDDDFLYHELRQVFSAKQSALKLTAKLPFSIILHLAQLDTPKARHLICLCHKESWTNFEKEEAVPPSLTWLYALNFDRGELMDGILVRSKIV